ncbi:MAG: SDR family NAD(P)-dependent oxidoreductase [Tatlockia sp.]|nr:SDR family NAD(P)-dependent oxidoreductase [Tatlockia sp.]
MKTRTWMILGATSIIAEEFAQLAAQAGNSLLLVGRNASQLNIIAADLRLRYHVKTEVLICDFGKDIRPLLSLFENNPDEIDMFIAFSSIIENSALNPKNIEALVTINIQSTVKIIQTYIVKTQAQHRIIFLSSVAACRGRAKNSLYGGSKALVETFLEGLEQASAGKLHLTIARLGFIDTAQTFGTPGIFYASPPKACAKACWRASYAGKRRIYHPFFWRFIMAIISRLPFIVYKKMKL